MPDDIVKQLRLAEIWFCSDSHSTVPIERKHGKWLFQTAADTIELLRRRIMLLERRLDKAEGYITLKGANK